MSKILKILILALLAFPVMCAAAVAGGGSDATVVELDVPTMYRKSLPKMLTPGDAIQPEAKAETVVKFLHTMGGGDPLNAAARALYINHLVSCMTNHTPIQFVILGFPCKSTNVGKKVLSQKFDMADYLGLVRLEHIAEQIHAFIGVPCAIHIIHKEPYIPEMFTAVERALDTRLLNSGEYEAAFLRLLETCPHLHCGGNLTREYLTEKTKEIYHTEAAKVPIVAAAGELKGFFAGELDCRAVNAILEGKGADSKNKLDKERKKLGLLMSEVYQLGVTVFRDMVRTHGLYGRMLRLSVHGDETKVGINFASKPGIAGANTCVPWRAALLCARSGDDVSLDLVRTEDMPAEAHVTTLTVASVELSYILM